MRKHTYSISKLFACLLLVSSACKQESIEGIKSPGNEPYKVYFLNAGAPNALVNAVELTNLTVDPVSKTVSFPLPIFRGGEAGSESFTVDLSVDNSGIPQLITSGALPANTVVLDANSYAFDAKETLNMEHDIMRGEVIPKIKIESLGQYVGKTVALGLKLAGSSKYSISESKNKVIVYFDVNKVAGPIYFPASETANNGQLNLMDTSYDVNNTSNEVVFNVPIKRYGLVNLGPFTVGVTVDNSIISTSSLPVNTVILDAGDYTLASNVTLSSIAGVTQGNVQPKLKISSLDKYSGKTVALGLRLTGSSQFSIDGSKDKAIVYFNADALADDVIPPSNLIVSSAWQVLKIAANDNVTFTVNEDESILAKGGSGGHRGVYQPIQVKAGRKYKIDMHVQGSGATDTWFEVYVGTAVPVQGQDYNSGGNLMGLNTWTGCGKSPFNGLLSAIACSGVTPKGVFTASTTGTMYVVIRGGGSNFGTAGIKMTNIDVRRVP